jgi:hypothetical protein
MRPLALACLVATAAASPARPAPPPVAHVFVALCDNDHQGIVPVSRTLGDGDDPVRNLYWGARHGMRTFLERAPGWRRLRVERPTGGPVLERVVFRHQPTGLLLVADGYRGREIAAAMRDFLLAAAGRGPAEVLEVDGPAGRERLALAEAGLVAYVGHDGLMDGDNPEVRALLAALPERAPGATAKAAMVIACASRDWFAAPLRRAGAAPWLLTTGLLPAEAYSLEAAAVAWARGGAPAEAREAAARAFARWQQCSLAAARRLFAGPRAQLNTAPNSLPTR